ncbi:MAG: LamG-like jellyroll fold domain-containing protein [Planctomycetota bacterium]
MCKRILFFVLVLSLVSSASATLIVYEGFDYASGGTLAGKNGGTGWDQAWTGGQTIQSPGLTYSLLPVVGNTAASNGQGGSAFRIMPSGFNALNRTLWISFIGQAITEASWSGVSTFNGAGESLFLGSPGGQPSSPYKWGVHLYNDLGDAGVPTGAQLTTINTTDKVFCVVRIVNGASSAQLTVWLNPALGAEPADGDAVFNSTVGRIPFDRIRIDAGNGVVQYDEIRIGEEFIDVTVFEPKKAFNPAPAHLAVNVLVETNLTWMRGVDVLEEEVYFGTDPCALPKVADILVLPTSPALYDPPGDLVASTTYYWEIIEVNGLNRYPSGVWEFTTVRGEARCGYPFDGAVITGDTLPYNGEDYIWTKLTFLPGGTASKHTGYFNEDYSKVDSRAEDANLGQPPYPTVPGWEYSLFAGNPQVSPGAESLVRGTKYYWTVDAEDAKGNIFDGDIWEFSIQGFYAFSPSPPNEAILISKDPFLSWLPGFGVQEHEIYMGTSWEDVNNAVYDYTNIPPEFVAARSEPNYQASGLPGDTKIYWRVDEVQGRIPPFFIPTALYKGDVWCFTTIPEFELTDPNRLGWWNFDIGFGDTAFDWSGHDNHGSMFGTTWSSPGPIGSDYCMGFNGTNDYIAIQDLSYSGTGYAEVTVCGWIRTTNSGNQVIASYDRNEFWRLEINGSGAGPGQVGWDVMTSTGQVDYGSVTRVDDGQWHHVSGVFDNGTVVIYIDGVPEPSTTGGSTFGRGATRYGFLGVGSEATGFDGSKGPTNYFDGYMDDFRIYDRALSQSDIRKLAAPAEAWIPSPYDGQSSVSVTTSLQWMPGKYASQHDVYLGTDKASVESATPSSTGIYYGRIGPNTLSIPLDAATLYYWRVDEVNLAGPDPNYWKGHTWVFRTVGAAGGLRGDYYEHTGAASPAGFEVYKLTRIDPSVDFDWGNGTPDPNVSIDDFSVRWSGHVEPLISGDWMFWTNTDDGVRLWIDDVLVIDDWEDQGPTDNNSPRISLVAGILYNIRMEYYENGGGAVARLSWEGPSTPREIIPPISLWPPLFATTPRPRDGATVDDRTPALEWLPGLYADYHELYFSASFDDVNNRTATKEVLGDPCRPFVGPRLELGRTYYWLVDEVQSSPAERWNARKVWSFTISECLSLDNMELYNDRNDIRVIWRDGSADVVWGGSYPYLTLVQGGSSGSNLNVSTAVGSPTQGASGPIPPTLYNDEAMVLYYDNDGEPHPPVPGEEKWVYDAPYYSEIEANTVGDNSLDVGQTWDSDGIKSLSLSFQGHPISDGYYDASLWPIYTIYGRGRDIWGRHDEFYYLSQYPFTGSGTVQVQVLSVANTDPWAKAGVMIREKWAPYSKFAAVFITPGQGVSFQYRDVEDGPCTHITKPGVTAPQYVKLERTISGAFEAKHSSNGFVWEDVNAPGQAPELPVIDMGDIADPNIYIGTAVSSHNANQICAADFDGLVISPLPPNWIYGNIGTNSSEQLYIALSDGVNTDVVEHNDVNAATLTSWQEWNIDLSEFTTVNLDAIKKVYIGLGDRDDPCLGGSGAIYVDDIRGCPPRCIPSLAKPIYDLAQPYDCIVNELDLALVGIDWLLSDRLITTSAPSDVNLTARYEFEGNFNDSSIHGYHATDPCGTAPGFDTGVSSAQALSLDGVDDHLVVGSVGIDGNTPRTIAAWVKASVPAASLGPWINIFGFTSHPGNESYRSFDLQRRGNADTYCIHVYSWEENIMALDQEWHHLAGTYDGTTIRWYGDGVEAGSADVVLNTEDHVQIGKRAHATYNSWNGLVDDARIYSVALSESEIAYLATHGSPTLQIPIQSIADVYQGEAPGNQWINFNDYALIADKYLEEILWPTTP